MARIIAIADGSEGETYDIWNKESDSYLDHGNFVIDGLVVHNSTLRNGVRSFWDLLAYNALGHPGPLAMIPEYVRRRDDSTQSWRQAEHELVVEILGDTYGIVVFQEQLTTMWQRIAGFTGPESQDARKAVAKKWKDKLKPIRKKWVDGASRFLGEGLAIEWWDKRLAPFGRYAFNRCLDGSVILEDVVTGESKSIYEWYCGDGLPSLYSLVDNELVINECVAIHHNGKQKVFDVEFDNEQVERATLDHKFKCVDGQFHTVREIFDNKLDVLDATTYKSQNLEC